MLLYKWQWPFFPKLLLSAFFLGLYLWFPTEAPVFWGDRSMLVLFSGSYLGLNPTAKPMTLALSVFMCEWGFPATWCTFPGVLTCLAGNVGRNIILLLENCKSQPTSFPLQLWDSRAFWNHFACGFRFISCPWHVCPWRFEGQTQQQSRKRTSSMCRYFLLSTENLLGFLYYFYNHY